jgi:hypothetical protein
MPCLGSFGDVIDEEVQIALCETRMTCRNQIAMHGRISLMAPPEVCSVNLVMSHVSQGSALSVW